MSLTNEQLQIFIHKIDALSPFTDKFRSLTASSTGELIKTGTGRLYRVNVINTAASIIYLKFYDKATVGLSTDTPFYTMSVPSGAGINVVNSFVVPDYFGGGLSVRCVTDVADSGTTNPATSPILEVRFI